MVYGYIFMLFCCLALLYECTGSYYCHPEVGRVLAAPFNPIALRKAKIAYNFGLPECNRVKLLCQFIFYGMGKVLSGELSCKQTGLIMGTSLYFFFASIAMYCFKKEVKS